MSSLPKKHHSLWTNKKFLFSVFFGVLLLVAGLQCSELARYHLQNTLHGTWEHDLILDHLPVMDLEYFLVWGLELLLIFLVAVMVLYPEYIPFSTKTIGLLYIIRSFFIILTPLGARPDQVIAAKTGFLYTITYGSNEFFFSGHVAFPFMLAVIFWQKPIIRFAMLFSTMLFAIAVLLAHTHYSIDVFAVPFIIPSIYVLSRKLFASDLKYLAKKDITEQRKGFLHFFQ